MERAGDQHADEHGDGGGDGRRHELARARRRSPPTAAPTSAPTTGNHTTIDAVSAAAARRTGTRVRNWTAPKNPVLSFTSARSGRN